MKRLLELNPRWAGLLRKDSGEAICFDCPDCGPTHTLIAYFENPLDGLEAAAWQKPTWRRVGESFSMLTIEPSIQYPCFHGWIERGCVFSTAEAPMQAREKETGRIVALSPLQTISLVEQMFGALEEPTNGK